MMTRLWQTAAAFVLAAIPAAAATGAPVVFNGKTLLTIQPGVGAFSAGERAPATSSSYL
ncbi:MAG: hypothetical protein ACLQVN_26660 [Bryobacteraceae bacterium]